ncbi:DsrE family protein [Halolamina salifodinae]|uniref:Intracellular sulfur oxidation DsrE/DsrF family protein n=2 Tax=Halolamina salifodinae TaxID=1202767 RepID=A0A8T4GUX2_9EURY|nr:DsrE family protein [Halolamina salifodinae]MBP1986190.1 intracellular sulfur oxidation DsrE/DsrF family protein [Halolamina salifodinae]
MRTVFHVSDADAYRVTESKVRNLLADESVDIDAVAVVIDHPNSIDAAAGRLRETTEALVSDGAKVKLCTNAFGGADAAEEAFPPGVELVSSGVGELTRLQTEGWAYIRL